MKAKHTAARPKVFISYSRHDFSLAEAVAATLDAQECTEPWLDSEKLEPGMDWDLTIEQAINDAEVLLLIASPAALVSPYVTREWKRAHECRKNIHICVVKAVDLPAELTGYPVHDLRSQFWQRVREVGYVIAARRTVSVAPVRRLNLVPTPVAILLVASLVITFASLWAALESWYVYSTLRDGGWFSDDPLLRSILAMELAGVVGTGLMMPVVAIQVLWRRVGYTLVNYFTIAAPCGLWLLFGLWTYRLSYPELASTFETRAMLGAALLIASAVGGGLMLWSRTVYLWLPAGEGYYRVRQRILRRKVQHRRPTRMLKLSFEYLWAPYAAELAALPAVDVATTFEIRYDQGDERIGQLIKCACLDAGLVEATSEATWVLRLVSSKTYYAKVREEIAGLGAQVICILVDSVILPEDSSELRRRQWLDFREQLPEGLYNLLRVLRSAEYTGKEPNPAPIDTSSFRAPAPVRGFVEACRVCLLGIGGFSIGLLVLQPLQVGVVTVAFVSLLPEVYLWWLLHSTAARLVTGRRFGIRCAVVLVLVLMWAGYIGALDPKLLATGATVTLSWVTGTVRLFRHLPTHWLPPSAMENKTPAVMPPVFTLPALAVAAMFFGLAAGPSVFTW